MTKAKRENIAIILVIILVLGYVFTNAIPSLILSLKPKPLP